MFRQLINSTILFATFVTSSVFVCYMYLGIEFVWNEKKITLCILVGQSDLNTPKHVVWSPFYVFVFVLQEEKFV